MTIQRQYSLPNCTLVVEGLSADTTTNGTSGRPLLSILVNAECRFAGYEQTLAGGREFLDNLVATVSNYAQEFLSGIYHPVAHHGALGQARLVQIERLDGNLHRLTVYPENTNGNAGQGQGSPTQIDLQTVQLFDLVEAIDQLFADSQTLPDLGLSLAPVSRRYATAQEPVAKRVLPMAVGVSTLAAAAIALFFVPVPEVRPPEPTTETQTDVVPGGTPTAPGAGTPGNTPPGAAPNPNNAPQSSTRVPSVAANAIPTEPTEPTEPTASPEPTEPTASPEPSSSGDPSSTNRPLSPQELSAVVNRAPEITEPEELSRLTQELRSQLDAAWNQAPDFESDLIYRVAISENGDILGFRYANQAGVEHVDQTPLLDLRYNAIDPQAPNPEPLAQFRVVFTPSGVVEVSPWYGRPPGDDLEE